MVGRTIHHPNLGHVTMSEDYRQRISELQDGELAPSEIPALLDALAHNPELRRCWERYTLIGQALRGEVIDPQARWLADRVQKALTVEPLRPLSRPRSRWSDPRVRLIGMGLAASVFLVAVLSPPLLLRERQASYPRVPLAARMNEQRGWSSQRWHIGRPELVHKLDRYLLTHQAAAHATAAKGSLPYVMLVGGVGGR